MKVLITVIYILFVLFLALQYIVTNKMKLWLSALVYILIPFIVSISLSYTTPESPGSHVYIAYLVYMHMVSMPVILTLIIVLGFIRFYEK